MWFLSEKAFPVTKSGATYELLPVTQMLMAPASTLTLKA
jgi:hypothetical protein